MTIARLWLSTLFKQYMPVPANTGADSEFTGLG